MRMTYTHGNVIVEDIKVGDIHFEFDLGLCIKSKVIEAPVKNSKGQWIWKSKNLTTGVIINYLVDPSVPSYYSVNLYNYNAYNYNKFV